MIYRLRPNLLDPCDRHFNIFFYVVGRLVNCNFKIYIACARSYRARLHIYFICLVPLQIEGAGPSAVAAIVFFGSGVNGKGDF